MYRLTNKECMPLNTRKREENDINEEEFEKASFKKKVEMVVRAMAPPQSVNATG